jgi:hypothetical protein
VWFGFALAVADVQVSEAEGSAPAPVKIGRAVLEPRSSTAPHAIKIPLTEAHLDAVALMRASGPVTLRDAIEDRAREEVMA